MRAVLEAIRRWEEKSLVNPALAERLSAEVAETSEAGTRRLYQYVLAATGAALLVIAAGVFVDWAWPRMTEALRTGFLGFVGLAAHLAGARLENRKRWLPAAYLMQTAGLIVIAIALIYSERAWPDLSTGGVVCGMLALITPFALGVRTLRLNSIMPAVHLGVGLLFIAVFLDRATSLDPTATLWVVDGVLAAAILATVLLLRRDPAMERYPWTLNAFAMALYAGFVLILFTADALKLENDTVYPLDAWLFLAAAATLYGIHRAPAGLRRGWFGAQLALWQLVWIPMGLLSTVGVVDGPPESGLVAVGGSGVAGLLYAREHGVREVMAVSALSLVVASWYWGVERAGALGAVFALAATAGLLFWFSGQDSPEE